MLIKLTKVWLWRRNPGDPNFLRRNLSCVRIRLFLLRHRLQLFLKRSFPNFQDLSFQIRNFVPYWLTFWDHFQWVVECVICFSFFVHTSMFRLAPALSLGISNALSSQEWAIKAKGASWWDQFCWWLRHKMGVGAGTILGNEGQVW